MAQRLVQINFKLNVSDSEYMRAVVPLAKMVADTAGLQWKIWILNEAKREAGGIYLFADESSTDAFLAGPIIARIKGAPLIRDFSVKEYDVMEVLTTITRGPVTQYAQGL
jgi:Putative mono-oxygenase ydhR